MDGSDINPTGHVDLFSHNFSQLVSSKNEEESFRRCRSIVLFAGSCGRC